MLTTKNDYNRVILRAIASGDRVTQRSLANELGVALGLTNLLIRRLVANGYVKISGAGTRHVRYLMTTDGWELLARETRNSLENTVHLYTETREQIRTSLESIAARCVPDARGVKPVVFYGAGDVAEIAYVSLQRTDLTLVGVVDDIKAGRFFGIPIHPPSALSPAALAGAPYRHVVVTSVRHAGKIRARLETLDVPLDRVSCL